MFAHIIDCFAFYFKHNISCNVVTEKLLLRLNVREYVRVVLHEIVRVVSVIEDLRDEVQTPNHAEFRL